MLAFFERSNAGANLRFGFYLMFIEQKRLSAVRILQSCVVSATAGVGYRFHCRDAHHQKLILARAFQLDRRDAGAFDSRAGDDDAVAAQERRVMRPEIGDHPFSQSEIVNAPAFVKDRHAIGKHARLAIEWNETVVEQAD